jgi:hypothetical protein
MRFTEIANPEDQLALWKLVSDKMWAAFGQQAQQQPNPSSSQQLAPSTPKATAKPISRTPTKPLGKRKATPVKAHKPKKAPMAPAPKPLPKPKPFQVTPTQASKQQTQQHQQLAHHIHQALTKKSPAPSTPQPTQPRGAVANVVAPMNNSYSERDKDELVFHRRENPLKPLRDQKPL